MGNNRVEQPSGDCAVALKGAANVAVGDAHTMSARAIVVTMMPMAGPLTPITNGLGKSISVDRNVSRIVLAVLRAAIGSSILAKADRSLPAE